MDDSETPTCNLQTEPQDGCHPGDSVASIVTHFPSASDENENQLDGDGHERLTGSDRAMGKPEVSEQDSLNNNESCAPSCEAAAGENLENTPCEGPGDGQDVLGKDKRIPGKRSSWSKRGTAKKIPQGSFKNYYLDCFLKITRLPTPYHLFCPAACFSSNLSRS